jgi:hypothetical protein
MSSPTSEEIQTPTGEITNEILYAYLQVLDARIKDFEAKQAALIASHNAVGENIAWLVANTQGVFQMFNNPEMMTKLMGQMMGGGK